MTHRLRWQDDMILTFMASLLSVSRMGDLLELAACLRSIESRVYRGMKHGEC